MSEVKEVVKADKRILSIDVIRILACFLVIANHTMPEYLIYKKPSAEWFIILTYFLVSRVAVPLFVIITGYNLLDKKTDYKTAFTKAIRFLWVLLFFGAVYYIKNSVIPGADGAGIFNFIRLLFAGRIWNTLWYLYLYIFMMILMPFIQRMVSGFNRKDFHVFLTICFLVCCVLPNIKHHLSWFELADFDMLGGLTVYIFYLVIGLYIKKYKYVIVESKLVNLMIFILSVLVNVLLTYLEYVRLQDTQFFYYSNLYAPTVIVGAICFFRLLYDLKISERMRKPIVFLAGLSLTVYLVADIFIEYLVFIREGLYDKGFGALVSCIVYQIAVVACSVIVSFIMKHLPGLKKIL